MSNVFCHTTDFDGSFYSYLRPEIVYSTSSHTIVNNGKKFVIWRGASPLEEMSPRDYVKDIKVPTLYVQARNDPWTEMSDIQGFYDDTPNNPKGLFWIEDTTHRFESYKYYESRPVKMIE